MGNQVVKMEVNFDIDNNRFIKIPNNFFYENSKLYNAIGGKYSFVLYCLITIRKNINDDVYLSIAEMNNLIYLDKNESRGRTKVRKSLQLIKDNKLIDFDEDNLHNDVVKIKWINLFPNRSDGGWIRFEYNDFDVFEIIGVDFYCIMWILRMYTYYETNTAFLQIKDIARLVGCKTIQVSRAIDLFEYTGLFEVKRGDWEHIEWAGEWKKKNNSYRYTGNIEYLLGIK